MARHLTWYASEHGWFTDLETVARGYMARHRVSRRTFYADFGRLVDAGMVRQTAAACPGRKARYQLCAPAELPERLPASLASALRREWGAPVAEQDQGQEQRKTRHVRTSVVERHRTLADCVMVSYGSAHHSYPVRESFCGRLHTSPFFRGSFPHPTHTPVRSDPDPASWPPWMGNSSNEEELARAVIERCRPYWVDQRSPAGLPDAAATTRLVPLVAGALRYLTSSDVVEVMTDRVASATDLGAVLATRLRQIIYQGRRASARLYDVQDGAQGQRARSAGCRSDGPHTDRGRDTSSPPAAADSPAKRAALASLRARFPSRGASTARDRGSDAAASILARRPYADQDAHRVGLYELQQAQREAEHSDPTP